MVVLVAPLIILTVWEINLGEAILLAVVVHLIIIQFVTLVNKIPVPVLTTPPVVVTGAVVLKTSAKITTIGKTVWTKSRLRLLIRRKFAGPLCPAA